MGGENIERIQLKYTTPLFCWQIKLSHEYENYEYDDDDDDHNDDQDEKTTTTTKTMTTTETTTATKMTGTKSKVSLLWQNEALFWTLAAPLWWKQVN